LHESSVELELKPDKPQEKLCGDASTSRVSTVSIDRQTLDLEALRCDHSSPKRLCGTLFGAI